MENSRITVDFETTSTSEGACNLTTVLDEATQEYIKRRIITRITSYKPNRKRVRAIRKARMKTIQHDLHKLEGSLPGWK